MSRNQCSCLSPRTPLHFCSSTYLSIEMPLRPSGSYSSEINSYFHTSPILSLHGFFFSLQNVSIAAERRVHAYSTISHRPALYQGTWRGLRLSFRIDDEFSYIFMPLPWLLSTIGESGAARQSIYAKRSHSVYVEASFHAYVPQADHWVYCGLGSYWWRLLWLLVQCGEYRYRLGLAPCLWVGWVHV